MLIGMLIGTLIETLIRMLIGMLIETLIGTLIDIQNRANFQIGMQITPLKAPSHGKASTLSTKMMKNTLKVIVDAKKGAKIDANDRIFL